MFLPTTPWRYSSNNLGSILHALFTVKRALVAGDTLTDNFGFFIDEHAHFIDFLTQ
jgi:hypothetical protein